MTCRLFEDGEWTENALRAHNEMIVASANIVNLLESIKGPIDLQDLHYVLTSAIGTFIAELSITRRLSAPSTPPRANIYNLPRLSKPLSLTNSRTDTTNIKDEHEYAWEKVGFSLPTPLNT